MKRRFQGYKKSGMQEKYESIVKPVYLNEYARFDIKLYTEFAYIHGYILSYKYLQ